MAVVEIAEFTLRSGLSDGALLAMMPAVDAFLARHGASQHHIGRDADGRIVHVVVWSDPGRAAAAMAAAPADPSLAPFLGAGMPGSERMRHIEPLVR